MLALDRPRRQVPALPLLVRVGVVVLVAGGLWDVAAHLDAASHAAHGHDHTAAEAAAHLTGFAGMVLVQAGVVADGVRRSLARRASGTEGKGVA